MAQKNPFEFNIWEPEAEKEERHKREREKLEKEHLAPEELKKIKEREDKFIDVFAEKFQEALKRSKETKN